MAQDGDGTEHLPWPSSIAYKLVISGSFIYIQIELHSYIKLRVRRHPTNRRPRFVNVTPYIKHHMKHEF